MKASDSVNSLTELNQKESDEKTCFICLGEDDINAEPLVDSKLLRNCGCRFSVHPACWNVWMKGKSDYDCPICRKDSMLRIKIPPNPVLAIHYEEERATYLWKPLRFGLCLLFTIGTIVLLVAILEWG
jgi:hypothetical protein